MGMGSVFCPRRGIGVLAVALCAACILPRASIAQTTGTTSPRSYQQQHSTGAGFFPGAYPQQQMPYGASGMSGHTGHHTGASGAAGASGGQGWVFFPATAPAMQTGAMHQETESTAGSQAATGGSGAKGMNIRGNQQAATPSAGQPTTGFLRGNTAGQDSPAPPVLSQANLSAQAAAKAAGVKLSQAKRQQAILRQQQFEAMKRRTMVAHPSKPTIQIRLPSHGGVVNAPAGLPAQSPGQQQNSRPAATSWFSRIFGS